MNLSLGLFAVAVYCVLHLGPTSCQPLETISEAELNRGLLQLDEDTYNGLLLYSIPAASSGKNLFKMPRSLSDDCVRTAKVTLQSFEKLSSIDTTAVVIKESVSEAVKHKATGTFHSQVELVCQLLNEKMKAGSSTFDESKAAVQVPKPAKDYIVEIPPGRKVEQWVKNKPIPFDDAEFIKFQIMLTLVKFRNVVTDEKQRELVAAAKAVDQMARRSAYKFTVDRVFKTAFGDFIRNLLAQGADKINENNIESHGAAFIKKLDQEFLDNRLLEEEYSKMKKEVMEPRPSKL